MSEYNVAFVTGASSGLGAGLVARLAARGTTVYAAARREEKLAALVDAHGDKVIPVVLDVTDTDATVAAVREADDASGGLDLVVANAGVGGAKRAQKLTWEDWVEPCLKVNVMGAFATLTAVLPQMVERDRGHLVGMSSIAALRGFPASGAYSASKAGLSIFLETLRVDLEGTGVHVTTLQPGYIKTPLTEDNRRKMPFLMEYDAGVDTLMKAIDNKAREVTFPLPMATAAKASRWLPSALYDRLAGK